MSTACIVLAVSNVVKYSNLTLIWCAGNTSYLTDAQNFYSLHINSEGGNDNQLLTDWNNVYWASNLLLANLTGTAAYHDAIKV